MLPSMLFQINYLPLSPGLHVSFGRIQTKTDFIKSQKHIDKLYLCEGFSVGK